jgi:PAS domain S-box-containing protein
MLHDCYAALSWNEMDALLIGGLHLRKNRHGNSTAYVMSERHSGLNPAVLNPVAWLAAIVEHSDDAIISKDLNGIVTSWNIGAEQIFGYKAAEIVGQSILKLIPPDRHGEEDFIIGKVRKGERIKHYDTVRRRKDGTLVDVSLTVSPILADGKIVGVSKIARDITSQKQVQLAQTLLLRELNHRTKNLLAVADAIVRQTSKSSPPEELLDRISRRLHALSVSQDLMIDSEWRGADITNIIQWQLASIIDDHTSRVKLNGPLCTLNPRTAQALGLAIFELATNALKFGSLSAKAGTVQIVWSIGDYAGRREFHMRWRELGGPPVIPPEHSGFGSTIIERMIARSLLGSAKVTYAPAGLIWELVAPESALIETSGFAVV